MQACLTDPAGGGSNHAWSSGSLSNVLYTLHSQQGDAVQAAALYTKIKGQGLSAAIINHPSKQQSKENVTTRVTSSHSRLAQQLPAPLQLSLTQSHQGYCCTCLMQN
jgi:hypothetical protein